MRNLIDFRPADSAWRGTALHDDLFHADVESFTAIAEQLSPQELSEQTSHYFEAVTSAVAEEGGTIDKFIGDCVMALWGAPTAGGEPCISGMCGGAKGRIAEWSGSMQAGAAEGREQMRVRIRTPLRHRRCRQCRFPCQAELYRDGRWGERCFAYRGTGTSEFGTSICISENVYDQVSDLIVARALGRASVKGRKTEIMVYELLGIAGSNDPELAVHPAQWHEEMLDVKGGLRVEAMPAVRPVYSKQQTFLDSVGTSHLCQKRKWRHIPSTPAARG